MYKHAIQWPSAIDAPTIDRTVENKKRIFDAFRKKKLMTGKIVRMEDFGVIVHIGKNLQGLLHISEISKDWVDDPYDFFKIGQEINVYVIDIQEDQLKQKYRVSLSTKQMDQGISKKPKRMVYTGRRAKITPTDNEVSNERKQYTAQDLLDKYNNIK